MAQKGLSGFLGHTAHTPARFIIARGLPREAIPKKIMATVLSLKCGRPCAASGPASLRVKPSPHSATMQCAKIFDKCFENWGYGIIQC